MPKSRAAIRRALQTVCSRNLWAPVPKPLENLIVKRAEAELAPEDINSSPYGELFYLAIEMVHEYIGYGCFATIYDD